MTSPEQSTRRRPSAADLQQRQAKLEALHTRLTEQVLTLTDGPAWKEWLTVASRFHHYSFGNTVAIWSQRPEARLVAGYRTWQSLGRQVDKGQRGIAILAPVTHRHDAATDDAGQQPARSGTALTADPAGTDPATADPGDARQRPGIRFRIAYVWDVEQTSGDPVPLPPRREAIAAPQLLTGQAPDGLWDGLARQVTEAGFDLQIGRLDAGVRGLTRYDTHHVTIDDRLEPAQQVKSLSHELAHVMLHGPQTPADLYGPAPCRGRVEVEAESVAFLVTGARGMDTSDYSFNYVAGWATHGQDPHTALAQTATRALSTAHTILERLDRDQPAALIPAEDTLGPVLAAAPSNPTPTRSSAYPAGRLVATPDTGPAR